MNGNRPVSKISLENIILHFVVTMSHNHTTDCLSLSVCVAVAILLAVIIILITGALVLGVFLNYKRTGSFIPSMPRLPRYLSSCHFHCMF